MSMQGANSEKILISGIGLISAIGSNVQECLEALSSGRTGIGRAQFLQTRHKDEFMLGEVKLSNEQLFDILAISEEDRIRHTRTSLLALSAGREALLDAGFKLGDFGGRRIGIISATTVGGMDKSENSYPTRDLASGFVQTHPSGDSTDKLGEYLGIDAYRSTLSTACSSAANAIMHGARLIHHGYLDAVLVGGVDPLSRFTLNGFNALMILDREWCCPFDQNRRGLNLGEGAGFIVIEKESSVKERAAKSYCSLAGYANANDAYHQTASSPDGEGAFMSMSKALEMSGLRPDEIDYINVHGTGTSNNDLSEGLALKRVFGDTLPPFSSTKAFTGHTLGAAAGVEAVISILAIEHGLIFPNLNFSEPIVEFGVAPVTKLISRPVRTVLSNSFGFGGNNSTLVFSR